MGLWLEEMGSFFDKRVSNYEEHMLTEVSGAKQAYLEIAKHIPVQKGLKMVDLGCGTGLELEEVFRRNPDITVIGIDLSFEMINSLKKKFASRSIETHQISYFDYDYGRNQFDTALSCMTLHHFSHEEKVNLYTKLYQSLVPGGRYVECDYMIEDPIQEDFYHSENERIRREHGITEGFYHYDTPCTITNQIRMLKEAGFTMVEKVFQIEGTVILICDKES